MVEKQHLLIFISKQSNPWDTNEKIAKIYMNKFIIDEDDATEIIGVHKVEPLGREEIRAKPDQIWPGLSGLFPYSLLKDQVIQSRIFVSDTKLYDSAFGKYIEDYQSEDASLHIIWAGQAMDFGTSAMNRVIRPEPFLYYFRQRTRAHTNKIISTFVYMFREFFVTTEYMYKDVSEHGLETSGRTVIYNRKGVPTASSRRKNKSSSVGDELERFYTRAIDGEVNDHEYIEEKDQDDLPICSYQFAMMDETEIEQMLDFNKTEFDKTFYRTSPFWPTFYPYPSSLTEWAKKFRKEYAKHYIVSMCHRKTYVMNLL